MVVRPSLLGVASSQPVMSMAAVAVAVMVVIPMVMAEVELVVTLAVPPLTATEVERRETELPALLGGGAHGSPTWSELEGLGGTMARLEVVHPSVSHGVLIVDILFSNKEDTGVEPLAILPSRELVMIRSSHDTTMAGSSSGSGVTHELVWPCPDESRKA